MNDFKMDNFKEWIDDIYEKATKILYDFIDVYEYASIRLIFWILHFTSVYFNIKLFNNIGITLFGDIGEFNIGLYQLIGCIFNLLLSIVTDGNRPYHEIFFSTTSFLFTRGVYKVLNNLPHLHPILTLIIYFLFSGLSLCGIWLFKKKFPKVNIDKVHDKQ